MYHSLPRIPSGTCVTSTRMLLHTDNEVLGTLYTFPFNVLLYLESCVCTLDRDDVWNDEFNG